MSQKDDHPSSDVAFTPTVKAIQEQRDSREGYAQMEKEGGFDTTVDERLTQFLSNLNSFYIATATKEGQPYIQHRGGPKGFLRILNEKTLGFADYAGKRHYTRLGNLSENDRVCLFLMDYEHKRRIKIWGRARVERDPVWMEKLMPEKYRARPEQAIIVTIEAWDSNCPQHILHLVPFEELEATRKMLQARIAELEAELAQLRGKNPATKKIS
jgi:predicted pyridoxine 5'-phosphate oxidase superfamily flavin-nucleotide-binding protein